MVEPEQQVCLRSLRTFRFIIAIYDCHVVANAQVRSYFTEAKIQYRRRGGLPLLVEVRLLRIPSTPLTSTPCLFLTLPIKEQQRFEPMLQTCAFVLRYTPASERHVI